MFVQQQNFIFLLRFRVHVWELAWRQHRFRARHENRSGVRRHLGRSWQPTVQGLQKGLRPRLPGYQTILEGDTVPGKIREMQPPNIRKRSLKNNLIDRADLWKGFASYFSAIEITSSINLCLEWIMHGSFFSGPNDVRHSASLLPRPNYRAAPIPTSASRVGPKVGPVRHRESQRVFPQYEKHPLWQTAIPTERNWVLVTPLLKCFKSKCSHIPQWAFRLFICDMNSEFK